MIRLSGTVNDSIVDGEGLRFTVFTQGCHHHCVGCHNQITWPFNEGYEVSEDSIIETILRNPLLSGVTFSGGEPFEQSKACTVIAKAVHEAGLNVWCYTGWRIEELLERHKEDELSFLSEIDVLIDGRFELDKKSYNCKWRGSTNQRILFPKDYLKEK